MRFVCLAPDCDFTTTVVYDAAAHSYTYGNDHNTTGAPMATYTATVQFIAAPANDTARRCMADGIAEHFGNVIGTFHGDEVDGSFKLVEGALVTLDEVTVTEVVGALRTTAALHRLTGGDADPMAEHYESLAVLIGGA